MSRETFPPTDDDTAVLALLCDIQGVKRYWSWLRTTFDADRRDADLMLEAQDWPHRSVVLVPRQGHGATWAEAIDVRQGCDRI